jgi:hypothetical protein
LGAGAWAGAALWPSCDLGAGGACAGVTFGYWKVWGVICLLERTREPDLGFGGRTFGGGQRGPSYARKPYFTRP